MKALLVAALAFATAGAAVTAKAATTQELEAAAQKAYDGRDYSQPGRASALQAAQLYGQLSKQATDASTKAKYMIQQAASCFFLGDSASDNGEKITQFSNGIAVSDAAVKLLGIKDVNNVSDADIAAITKRPKDQIILLAEGLYVRGINLGQWGQANGVMQSLDKWPELRTTMELIVKIGAKSLHEYGAYRTLGRGYFKIPALLGGDVAKAQKYLSTAVNGSIAPGQVYSTNGYNNLFYADLLKDQGQDAQAKKLLQDFLKADPNTLLPGYAAETREAQRQATEMLKNW
jgi:hypothetical protein